MVPTTMLQNHLTAKLSRVANHYYVINDYKKAQLTKEITIRPLTIRESHQVTTTDGAQIQLTMLNSNSILTYRKPSKPRQCR